MKTMQEKSTIIERRLDKAMYGGAIAFILMVLGLVVWVYVL